MEAAVGPWGSGGAVASRGGNIAGDAAPVGDPAKWDEGRRDNSGCWDVGEWFCETDRRDVFEGRFWRLGDDLRFCRLGVDGVDLRRSSRRELELGERRGTWWLPEACNGVS